MDRIYYVFSKQTGAFMGSGTVWFDDESFGSTETRCDHDPQTETAHWNGSAWIVAPG
ncbi:hypothetical protein [Pseudorhodoplanes sp.]|uniref:hypothetical protein n=1 Tax=Pseudorhodoplanes sp. TaxID=1934341 RepID=UPI003D0ACF65